MSSSAGKSMAGVAAVGVMVGATSMAFSVVNPGAAGQVTTESSQRFLAATPGAEASGSAAGLSMSAGAGALLTVAGLAVAGGRRNNRRSTAGFSPAFVGCSAPVEDQYFRDQLIASRAQVSDAEVAPLEEMDIAMAQLQEFAKKSLAGAAAAMVFVSSVEGAEAYPIFAQQNYANPRAANGKIACANCHLATKPLDVRLPHDVLADTIFKAQIEIPCKYEKRRQPLADGSKGPLNVGAVAVMPEGWKLAPKERLPKDLKKEMKGLAWSAYSKEYPNIVVAGPVPGERYERMILPILAPDPNTQKGQEFGKFLMYFGGNRGRGQVYPEGNQSNNNQFFAVANGKIAAIDGLKVTIEKEDGTTTVQELLPGAQIVVEVGEVVKKDDPITTNPNVGGFGQEEKEIQLQDMNRVYAYVAVATSLFICQLAFVLKKKQFEKVQLAEGF
jgi:apocytochrome f